MDSVEIPDSEMVFKNPVPEKFIAVVNKIKKPKTKVYEKLAIHPIDNKKKVTPIYPFKKNDMYRDSTASKVELLRDIEMMKSQSPRTALRERSRKRILNRPVSKHLSRPRTKCGRCIKQNFLANTPEET